MYIGILLRLIFGYVRVEIEGYYIERFINICTMQKVLIWNLKREKGVKLYLNVGINDFRKLIEICKKTKCRAKIHRKRGIPFLLNKYKKRKIFLVFLVIITALIIVSSNYVWNIQIDIEDNLELQNIEEDLEEQGLKTGILKNKINSEKIINEIMLKRNDISWMGIDIEGTNVIVKLVKADEKPEIIENTEYCNIIAKKSGIITKIIAQNGTATVKVGDTVQKGSILISGIMEGQYTEPRPVRSMGEVLAKVWYTESKKVSFKQQIETKTGAIENKYRININGLTLNLYRKLSKFEDFDTSEEECNLKLGGNFYIPVKLTKIKNEEKNVLKKVYTIEEAKEKAEQELKEKIEEQIENKDSIVNVISNSTEEIDGVEVKMTYEVIENIGEEQGIEFENLTT